MHHCCEPECESTVTPKYGQKIANTHTPRPDRGGWVWARACTCGDETFAAMQSFTVQLITGFPIKLTPHREPLRKPYVNFWHVLSGSWALPNQVHTCRRQVTNGKLFFTAGSPSITAGPQQRRPWHQQHTFQPHTNPLCAWGKELALIHVRTSALVRSGDLEAPVGMAGRPIA